MATITNIASGDTITSSRTVINDNFTNLNSDKIETSYLDTDTTLAANSDVKIPSQKAVKAYVDTGGNVNATETTKGIVEEATNAEVTAGTATGATGAKLFVTPAKLATRLATLAYVSTFNIIYRNGTATMDTDTVSTNTSQTIAHGLGTTPRRVRIETIYKIDAAANNHSIGTWANSQTVGMHLFTSDDGTDVEQSGSFILKLSGSTAGNEQTATLTVDAANLTLSWVKSGSPTGTRTFIWEAEGFTQT